MIINNPSHHYADITTSQGGRGGAPCPMLRGCRYRVAAPWHTNSLQGTVGGMRRDGAGRGGAGVVPGDGGCGGVPERRLGQMRGQTGARTVPQPPRAVSPGQLRRVGRSVPRWPSSSSSLLSPRLSLLHTLHHSALALLPFNTPLSSLPSFLPPPTQVFLISSFATLSPRRLSLAPSPSFFPPVFVSHTSSFRLLSSSLPSSLLFLSSSHVYFSYHHLLHLSAISLSSSLSLPSYLSCIPWRSFTLTLTIVLPIFFSDSPLQLPTCHHSFL